MLVKTDATIMTWTSSYFCLAYWGCSVVAQRYWSWDLGLYRVTGFNPGIEVQRRNFIGIHLPRHQADFFRAGQRAVMLQVDG